MANDQAEKTAVSATVDVSGKAPVFRRALAEARLCCSPVALQALREKSLRKGDIREAARTAALLAMKKTPELIPHCHPLRLTAFSVEITEVPEGLRVLCEARAEERTGPEMEALSGAAVAALTLHDGLKEVCPEAEVNRLRLLEKDGGKSGNWRRGDGD